MDSPLLTKRTINRGKCAFDSRMVLLLPQVIPFKMLPFLIIILLTLAQNGLMVSKQQSLSHYNPNLISSPQLSPFEMDVPEHLEALGSRLTVRIRLSPHLLLSNMSEFPQTGINTRELYLQLGIHERTGDLAMLTQEKLKKTISTNWQDVNFDCGWIVRGGKYSVYLQYYPDPADGDEFSPVNPASSLHRYSGHNPGAPSTLLFPRWNETDNRALPSSHTNQYGSAASNQTFSVYSKPSDGSSKLVSDHPSSSSRPRVLVKKTINVKYPTIMFEVPTRLETYSTSAPVTFGLTRTICKPKLELPSTVLSLTMCSTAAAEISGPSASHFSSSDGEQQQDHQQKREGGNPFNKPSQIHSNKMLSASPPSSTAHQHESSHNRDRHHRRYNPDHYSSSSRSWPTQTLKSMRRHNNASEDGSGNPTEEIGNHVQCHRDITTIFQEPLLALQTEGRITINVDCRFWGRNATYVIQMRETASRNVITQSPFIKVEWSSQFSLDLNRKSIFRCQGYVRARVSYPQCILPGRDKIRVLGHETLSVPSLLAPNRVSYIGELQIHDNIRIYNATCNMFPARFLRFCFQYVNTAVDDSVAVVIEKCIPTGPANKISDGGWSPWSKWTVCSVTCGSGGKRFRYRFCDSPPPTSGANFCQGKPIQEEACDTGIPCPQIPVRRQSSGQSGGGGKKWPEMSSSVAGSSPAGGGGELDHVGGTRSGGTRKYGTGSRPTFMDFSVLNVSRTSGCECGCILYDLIPSKNYSLVIIISANQSSCADEDEEDHHNFRWILHAKNEKDRIQLDIVGMDVQCVTMTFRDGNTTDSNLLEVITASQPSDPIQFEGLYEQELGQKRGSSPATYPQPAYQYEDEELDSDSSEEESDEETLDESDNLYGSEEEVVSDNVNTKGHSSILRIESTGPSLSIGTTSDSSKNCSGQFIYFIAYYTTIPTPDTGVAERKEERVGYDFWTFLILKIMVLFFIAVVLCSTFGGCATKVYRKYKYKELKCFENEDEEGSLNDEGMTVGRKSSREGLDDASRCTSITLMSFDYSYWRRLRILRLKYFLLRPRPLDPVTTKTKSFPNTPTVSTKLKEKASTSAGRSGNAPSGTGRARPTGGGGRGDEPISKLRGCDDDHHNLLLLNKPISFSETNLREKSAVLAVTKNGYELRPWNRKGKKVTTEEGNSRNDDGDDEDDDDVDDDDAATGDVELSTYPQPASNSQEHGSVSDMYGGDGTVSLTSTSVSISMSQSLNGSETASSNSIIPTPTPTPAPGSKFDKSRRGQGVELSSSGIKLLKEKENLKRKAGDTRDKSEVAHRDVNMVTPRSLSSSENSHRETSKKWTIRPGHGKRKVKQLLQHGDSTASMSTVQSARTTGDDDSSRVASRADLEDTDQDFEMDYYDYDVMNAGNIPGSYLGLEPAFVLWNSEVYPHSDDGVDGDEDGKGIGAHLAEETQNCMEDSAYGIEMISSGSSVGMFSGDTSSGKEFGMKETSLDTLKFADDDDDDELESLADSHDSVPIRNLKDTSFSSQHNTKYKISSHAAGDLGKS